MKETSRLWKGRTEAPGEAGLIRRSLICLGVLLCWLGGSGCGGSVECGETPDHAIEGFEVMVETGDDGTSMDIFFCFQRKGGGGVDECLELDNPGVNDFRKGLPSTFRIKLRKPLEKGELLSTFKLRAARGFLDDNEWEVTRWRVSGIAPGGQSQSLLFDKVWAGDAELNDGDSTTFDKCTF